MEQLEDIFKKQKKRCTNKIL